MVITPGLQRKERHRHDPSATQDTLAKGNTGEKPAYQSERLRPTALGEAQPAPHVLCSMPVSLRGTGERGSEHKLLTLWSR